jgi:hypothetical protein
MTNREIERLFKVPGIASADITPGSVPLPRGVFEQAPRVVATLDDGRTPAEVFPVKHAETQ